MTEYIATFYSHFGAVRFVKELSKVGGTGKMKPVPRTLSSSCGTCVFYTAKSYDAVKPTEEIEQIVEVLPEGYKLMYSAEEA